MNLTPEQLELLLYLVGALILGFLFGYLLSRAYARQRYGVEIEELSDLLDTRDREIESASAKHGQLKQHMAVQANELKESNQKMVDVQSVISDFESNSKLIDDEKIEFESLLLKKDMKISELNEEAGFARSELTEIQNLVDDYKVANSTNNEKLLTAQHEIEQNAKLSHSLVKKSEEHTLKVKTLESQRSELDNKVQTLTNQRSELDNKVQTLTKSILEKDNVINEYKKRTVGKEVVERENQELKAKMQNITKELSERKPDIVKVDESAMVELKQKYSHLQTSLENVKKDVTQKDTNILNLQQSLNDTKKQITEKDTNIVNLQKDKSTWEEQIRTIQSQQSSNHDSLQNEVLNIKAELFRKDKKLKVAEEKLHMIQNSKSGVSDKNSTYLSENENSVEGTSFMKFVKDTFTGGDKK